DSPSVKPFTKYIKPAAGILFHGPSSLSFKQLLKVKMLRSNKKHSCRDNFLIVLNRFYHILIVSHHAVYKPIELVVAYASFMCWICFGINTDRKRKMLQYICYFYADGLFISFRDAFFFSCLWLKFESSMMRGMLLCGANS